MTEAIFGLIGVLLGSGISWFQSYWSNQKEINKSAKYLAIRIVCILDQYLDHCTDVVKDDGLSYGQRTPDGCLQAQVATPPPPVYPDDVDWKSIDHELMFRLLSFPSEIEDGNRMIKATWEIAGPPDYEEWFNERKYQYSIFGLTAYRLSNDLAEKYGIKKKVYNNWNPVTELKNELEKAARKRHVQIEEHKKLIKRILG
ncbi:hypothetical protein [Chryseobacterium populi]|uniref:Uncharacterized protein n=1 Tax=Chryseobacterium populi TaxID=1144316 RepID=J2KMP9_9FLAO|nr:hypothetical protein [Chryseobacterium populi]EJL74368.1 hypothetical protein PMI13_01107 [Chryseobacterium populi]